MGNLEFHVSLKNHISGNSTIASIEVFDSMGTRHDVEWWGAGGAGGGGGGEVWDSTHLFSSNENV